MHDHPSTHTHTTHVHVGDSCCYNIYPIQGDSCCYNIYSILGDSCCYTHGAASYKKVLERLIPGIYVKMVAFGKTPQEVKETSMSLFSSQTFLTFLDS